MKQTTLERQLEMYNVFTRDIIRRNQKLLEGEQINAIDKELLTAYYTGTKSEASRQTVLKFSCECPQQHYHQNAVPLIDEQALFAYGAMYPCKAPVCMVIMIKWWNF